MCLAETVLWPPRPQLGLLDGGYDVKHLLDETISKYRVLVALLLVKTRNFSPKRFEEKWRTRKMASEPKFSRHLIFIEIRAQVAELFRLFDALNVYEDFESLSGT